MKQKKKGIISLVLIRINNRINANKQKRSVTKKKKEKKKKNTIN